MNHYLVFIKEARLSDTLACLSTGGQDLELAPDTGTWQDVHGPMLVLEQDAPDEASIWDHIKALYPNADPEAFFLKEMYTAKDTRHLYTLAELEDLIAGVVDYEAEEGYENGKENLEAMGFTEEQMIHFGFPEEIDE